MRQEQVRQRKARQMNVYFLNLLKIRRKLCEYLKIQKISAFFLQLFLYIIFAF